MTAQTIFLATLCQSLMRQPRRLHIETIDDVAHIVVLPGDISRIIGKQGETINALTKVMEGIGVRIRADEPDEKVPSRKPLPEPTLAELVERYYSHAGQQVTVAVSADGEQVVVAGSQCDPSVDRALAAIIFKIAKNRGQVCNVEHR